jgi:Holliday junction DNA helicase RuvB
MDLDDLNGWEFGSLVAGVGLAFDLAPPLGNQQQQQQVVYQGQPGHTMDADTPPANYQSFTKEYVETWEDYVGQEQLKHQLSVHIDSASWSCEPLDHVLLSGFAGYGKTTLAKLIAGRYNPDDNVPQMTMLVPPFTPDTLYQTALEMDDYEFLFIDEIHKLADNGPRAAENLLHLLEEGTLYLNDGIHRLADFTVIGATTDRDKLPETIIDRFPIKPVFKPYSDSEMLRIAFNFTKYYKIKLLPATMVAIAKASRGTPRLARELVQAARDIQIYSGVDCQPDALLGFKDLEPNGLGPQHRHYLVSLYGLFRQETKNGVIYVAGESAMLSLLRETKNGLARIERFLLELGYIDRSPRGRMLTQAGIKAAQEFQARGGW